MAPIIVYPQENTFVSYATYTFPIAIFVLLIASLYEIRRTGNIFNYYTMTIFILFPFLVVAALLYNNETFVPSFSKFFLFGIGIYFLLYVSAIIYNTASYYSTKIKSTAYYALIILITFVAFTIIMTLITYFMGNENAQGFFSLFFALPGLFIELIKQLRDELKISTSPIIILIIFEIILVILAILIPFLIYQNPPFYSSLQFNGVRLLQTTPLNLTNKAEIILANSHSLSIVDDPASQENPYKKQYSISFWVYMNSSESALTPYETTILYYGSKKFDNVYKTWSIENPKPRITYMYDTQLQRDIYNIYSQNTSKPMYRLNIPNQKWNQIVLIYDTNEIILYVNGHLEKSFPISVNDAPIFTSADQIAIGDINSSVYGSIANIIYYDYPMTKNQVVDSWNKQKYWVDGSVYVPYSRTKST